MKPSKIFANQADIILATRDTAPAVQKLDPYQLRSSLAGLLIRASVITGWPLPKSEVYQILLDEFEKLLLESYPILNIKDLEYAFRHFGDEKEYGKEMNLSLIKGVLMSYWADRQEAVRNAKDKPENTFKQIIYSDEQMENEIRGKIEVFYQLKLKGVKEPLWMDFWAETLLKDGFIKDVDQVDEFVKFCLDTKCPNIYKKD